MDKMIEVKALKKNYGNIKAVNGIDFYVEKGSLFSFLGPNGAGKSTTIDIISTLISLTEGKVIVDGYELGKDDEKIRQQIGVVFQHSVLDDLLTVKENLTIRGAFYQLKGKALNQAVNQAMQSVGIEDIFDRPYGKLSGGQKRKVDIARALINTPKILFLDEPTTGLDPKSRQVVWNIIKKIQQESNMTVFLTTHYMEEAAKADYVVVIDNGLIIAKGTPGELKEKYSHDQLKIESNQSDKIALLFTQNQIAYTLNNKIITVKLEKTIDAIPMINLCSDYIQRFEVISGSMDDAFINIIGKEMTNI